MKRFVLLFSMLLLLIQGHAITITNDSITLETIDPAARQTLNLSNTARINFDTHEETYYQNEVHRFLIDFQWTDMPDAFVDRVKITVNKTTFELEALAPFFLTGLDPGEINIAFDLIDSQGESIAFPTSNSSIAFNYAEQPPSPPMITNDAVVFGLLVVILALIFWTNTLPGFQKFYKYVPALLLCYFVPAIFNSLGIVSGEQSSLYYVASRFLLPASLILLCISIDLKGVLKLGPKAIIMFLTATVGIIIGGPVALYLVSLFAPEVLGGEGPEEIWRGLATVAGSWIGGGANQTAMKEIYGSSDKLFSAMIVVDVFVANIWMAFLLFGAGISKKVDGWFKADDSAIVSLKDKIENYQKSIAKVPTFKDLSIMLGVAFGAVGVSHFGADLIAPSIGAAIEAVLEINPDSNIQLITSFGSKFFWLVVLATTIGLVLSFTKARKLEGVGASKVGSIFLYILVATIGMKMDIGELIRDWGIFKYLITVGLVWMVIHVGILLLIAKLIKAPFFFVAVGSQANVGGAASAPIVASAFSPALAPVGVLLAVFGYAIGTFGAIVCAILMQWVSM